MWTTLEETAKQTDLKVETAVKTQTVPSVPFLTSTKVPEVNFQSVQVKQNTLA